MNGTIREVLVFSPIDVGSYSWNGFESARNTDEGINVVKQFYNELSDYIEEFVSESCLVSVCVIKHENSFPIFVFG